MDFSALIKKSFTIAWHNRVLWVFGLLAGSMGGAGGINPSFNFSFPTNSSTTTKITNNNFSAEINKFTSMFSTQTWITIILVAVIVIIIVLIIATFVSSWAAAALVYCTLNVPNERPTFKKGARAGLKYWWKFYLLTLVLGMIALIFYLLLALPLLFLFLAHLQPLLIIYFIFAVIVFIISIFVISVFSSIIIMLAQRLLIHRGLGVLESIRVAGHLIKKHIGETFLTYCLALVLNFGAGFAFIIALLPIIIIAFVVMFINIIVSYFLVFVLAIVLLVVAGGFWQAYIATYWTLFYQHLASKEGW